MKIPALFCILAIAGAGLPGQNANPELALPLKPKSVRFAIIGDFGTGGERQYELAPQINHYHEIFPFEFVLTMGDNLYGGQHESDFKWKFEYPYRVLLDSGVKFYASLGNHDSPNQVYYKPFNMNGRRYYDFRRGDAAFFALDSNYMDPEQVAWLRKELTASNAKWKICYFHHPLYSHAKMHGSDTDLRKTLEPLFEETGVRLVLSGHEHVYERLKPQHGIYYIVLGSSGELRPHDLRPSPDTAKGFDTDNTFAIFEISEDECYFQVISRMGLTVDSGAIPSLLIEKSGTPNPLALQHHEGNTLGGADLLQRVAVHHQ
uniref:Metallophosphoesterase n=1 Tax=Solibacter usitatus (strain Ellin6076) TaxID=234267 RepID=Q02CW9_SOLUE